MADVRERWSAFWNGLRMMAAAGLMPMLTFCLAFLLVIRIPWALGEVLRLAIGATAWAASSPAQGLDLDTGFSLAPWLAVLLLFVLARVFAEGTRLRDDLAGTV